MFENVAGRVTDSANSDQTVFRSRLFWVYHIYSAIRQGFAFSRMTTKNEISPMKFCYMILPFLNSHKDLDPSYKMDLDFWDCFGRKKTASYNRSNTVHCLPRYSFPIFSVIMIAYILPLTMFYPGEGAGWNSIDAEMVRHVKHNS